ATIVSWTGNRVHLQVAPGPSAGTGRPAARTIQDPFFPGPFHHRYQIGSVRVGTEPNQISSKASRTLNAMTNTRCHAPKQPDEADTDPFTPNTLIVKHKVVGNNSHLTAFGHDHYDPPS